MDDGDRAEDLEEGPVQTHRHTLVLHDYVTQRGGAERVALLLALELGGGKLTTSAYSATDTYPEFGEIDITELAPLLPRRAKVARLALAPFAAYAFARHTVVADVVLCSSSGWSHWTKTSSPTVVYCHTPPRWFWASHDYFASVHEPVGALLRLAARRGRGMDRRRALRRTTYVANSSVVRDRIRAAYGREAAVIPPPVSFVVDGPVEPVVGLEPGFVLTVARSRGYKNSGVGRQVFAEGGLGQLVVVGDGEAETNGNGTVTSTGRVSDAQLRWLYRSCRAVLALSYEDFGLTPVEGHLFGKPTVALRAGGYLDTCVEGENAVFSEDLELDSVRAAVRALDARLWSPAAIAATAERFSVRSFVEQIEVVLREAYDSRGEPRDQDMSATRLRRGRRVGRRFRLTG